LPTVEDILFKRPSYISMQLVELLEQLKSPARYMSLASM